MATCSSSVRSVARAGLILLALWVAGLPAHLAAAEQPPTDGFFNSLKFRHIGPIGNRVSAVAGVAGDANTYFAGAASGGVWKSDDGGVHWRPTFDDQPASSIGALAVAPSDPNVVWAGTGETFIRSNISIGNGIYRSTDGGETWQHRGLDNSGRIGRIVVHPKDPDTAWVAALGHCYGPQEERGVYRTGDGGETWQRVLFAGADAGASDLVIDPTNPRVLYAGTWQMVIWPWGRQSGGPQSGLWKSTDSGTSWQRLNGPGLPEAPWGKIGLAISAADPQRIYALIETSSNHDFAPSDPFAGVLWASDDGGKNWRLVSRDNRLVQRPLYYSRMAAAPDDRDELYFMAVEFRTSLDGGKTSTESRPGWDHHVMWIDPQQPDRRIVGHDGGVSISTNRGKSWRRPQLPIAQMYHVAVDDQIPYFVYGNRQDGPALRGPSRFLAGEEIPIGAWQTLGGCEVGFTLPTPGDADTVWTGCYDGILELYDHRSGHARNVSVWPMAVESWPAAELKYRFQWTYPIVISPHDPGRVYVGSQFVHRTTDGGQSWQTISPDLTTDDPALQQRSGGLTLDDAGPSLAPVIFALAESKLEEGLIWAGTNDGQVQLSRDGGENWRNVTARIPALPELGTISNVEPSPHRAGSCLITVDRHQLGDTKPYVYRTDDYGQSWRKITDGIPESVFSYAHCVREDPRRPELLYLGTENGLYVSFDGGGQWQPLQSNLPPAPVHWLTVQEHFYDLVVATYGRGFWILDDLTPLAQYSGEPTEPALLAPRPAYRFRTREEPISQPDDPAAGSNPPEGASLHYYLPADNTNDDEKAEALSVTLEILDPEGGVIRELDEVSSEAGLHRLWWDLYHQHTPEVRLRTRPLENPETPLPSEGWRPQGDGGRMAVLAPPGIYTVRLTVGSETWSQELELRRDPATGGSDQDLERQTELVMQIAEQVSHSAELINEVEWARKQLIDLGQRLQDSPQGDDSDDGVADDLKQLSRRLAKLEGHFFDLRLTGAGQDTLRWKRLLAARLTQLAWGVARADYPPTDAQQLVFQQLAAAVEVHQSSMVELRQEIVSLNLRLRQAGIEAIVLAPPH